MVNTILKNHFEIDLNFQPIRVIRFRNSDPYANVSKLHEYCNKLNGKSLMKIFYFIDCGNTSYKFLTSQMNKVRRRCRTPV